MKKIIQIIASIMVVIGITYAIGTSYYADRFQAKTNFSGIDIGHLSPQEAHTKIQQQLKNQTITFYENNQNIGKISLADLNAEIDAASHLESLLNSQNNLTWVTSFFSSTTYQPELKDYVSISENSFSESFEQLGLVDQERTASTDARIAYAEDKGYYLEPETIGNQLDLDTIKNLVVEGIQTGQQKIEVNAAYTQPMLTVEDGNLNDIIQAIEETAATEITLTIAGFEETITREQIMSWLYLDEQNDLYFDELLIYDYLGTLNERYATYDDYRYFESTLQGEIQLEPGTLGWSIDREAETQSILEDLYAGLDVKRETSIVGTGYNGVSLDDIGSSYIEVDMISQNMFVYLDGVQVISTPVVTGQIGTTTVPGTYAIWNMETPSALVGYNPRTEQDYEQPVQYWMAFDDTGQGIHDADWQPYFGGDAYLTNGSLGCVNTPPNIMPTVFEYAYLGMPVIVFH